jgi:hypothetical protein
MTDYTPLWHWVREREATRIRKEVQWAVPPFTEDPIIAAYRFCNVRREDDRVTRWIAANIRDPFADHPLLWLMLCIARQINWPDTLRELIFEGAWPNAADWTPARMADALQARADRGEKVWTGAYVISAGSEKGQPKSRYIAETVIGNLWRDQTRVFRDIGPAGPTLRHFHMALTRYDGWGAFMAYQAIVDMRFTRLLREAPDIATWAAAGPGTIRGLNRVHGRRLDFALPQDRALTEMRAIYAMASQETGVAMDFSDVPNILCETDKYLRVKNGEGKPRASYVPGRGW